MSLTPIAKVIQRIMSKNEAGFKIEELFQRIKEINNFITPQNLESNLERYPDIFTFTSSDKWRLKAFVEEEQKKKEVKNRLDGTTRKVNSEAKEEKKPKGNQQYYFNLRENYIKTIEEDLIGPKNGDTEVLEERPNVYYLGGMLYPANVEVEDIEVLPVSLENNGEDYGDNHYQFRDETGFGEEEPADEEVITNQNLFRQSSVGFTCRVPLETKNLRVKISYGKYEEVTEGKKKRYKREPFSTTETISLEMKKDSFFLEENNVECMWLVKKKDKCFFVSIFLVNRYEDKDNDVPVEHIIFQPVILVTAENEEEHPFLKRETSLLNSINDKDMFRSQLLYRNQPDFAVGHGSAVEWNNYSSERAGAIKTTFIPTYEVPAVEHLDIKGMSGLDMYILSYIEDGKQLKQQLMPLVEKYEDWIKKQEKLSVPTELEDQRQLHIDTCYKALERIREGIEIVCNDQKNKEAFKAFKFANEMMLYQRSFSEQAKYYRTTGQHAENLKLGGRWRPFQLAFILLNIKSMVYPNCKERDWVDLLWFPTGGGKTEAYLGLASFVIALRRLNCVSEGVEGYAGTTILMRYTLRLLTIQQFQRAATLICAAEYLRDKDPVTWGSESFSIGLWVGGGTTPNQLEGEESATEALEKLKEGKKVYGGNPIQLHSCPCCGEELTPECYEIDQKVFTIHCQNVSCFFSKNNIPAYTVDEAIYSKCPTILIGTVDKFARLPWNGNIASLFGKVDRYCERHGFIREGNSHPNTHNAKGKFKKSSTVQISNLRPPELIIQDELHLISGPLGSMVGLYESAIDYLSTYENSERKIRPKVVASTATIRRAEEQVKGVFNRDVRQFPPSGVNAEDSFFSYEVSNNVKPGRKYVGLYFPGSSGKTSLVRIYASLLQKGQLLKLLEENVDPYWTLTGYFNSLRELGGTLRLVEDDIPDRIKYLVEEKGKRRFLNYKEELTSRIDATEIPKILSKLEQPADQKRSVDVLLATNMISVGVDIDRLGLMVVTGQPKSTSEYIQATSRVGRKYPGLVFTLYNWSRPRDISHYEQFVAYHSKFYSHVEATSVTPFSYRARDKALRAVVIGLLRQLDSTLFRNSDARRFEEQALLQDIKYYIAARCSAIDEVDNQNIEEEIDSIINWWIKRVKEDPDELHYQQYHFMKKTTPVLFKNVNQEIENAELIPDSLRDVEGEVDVYYTYLQDDEGEGK
ncbi:DISARM system helicase DrmA [Peribacillus frigoritolerans]|uniref:DISARM system helicase DrmA n=1 Tax=Peribacillus frigoritolerans TaxID=450367 RepID=UPI0037F69A9C